MFRFVIFAIGISLVLISIIMVFWPRQEKEEQDVAADKVVSKFSNWRFLEK